MEGIDGVCVSVHLYVEYLKSFEPLVKNILLIQILRRAGNEPICTFVYAYFEHFSYLCYV